MGRRDDPNYAQVSGYINKDLVMKFKLTCTASEISQTDALEEAIALWLAQSDQGTAKTKKKKPNQPKKDT